ncbi:acyl-CoA dehydrogenase family protein [Desertimonas flava]|uniref:acyl-CoA dehydrogenase family protein n=1 Tax=Desertimonas flava TaxID=2064846 RepID=UPI000E3567AA|nr:acyl-CoA dehydrogenase [Desertimonas flava]
MNVVERVDDTTIEDLVDGLGDFLRAEVFPRTQQLIAGDGHPVTFGPDGRFTPEVLRLLREVRERSAAAGFYTMLVPTELGGGGLGAVALYRAWETVYRVCGAEAWLGYHAVAHWSRGPSPLLAKASAKIRDALLGPLLRGETTLCFAMSEPDAGSDVWRMRTAATPVAGGWELSGTKQWITNAPYADYAIVFAVDDHAAFRARSGGLSAFVVPVDRPGFSVDSVIRMFGHVGGDEGIVSLDRVVVGSEYLLGERGAGLGLAMSGVSTGRLYNCARSVGLARWALDKALRYASDRVAFGRPIIDNQGIGFPLAEAAMRVHAARLAGLHAARLLDAGRPARLEVAAAKALSTETAVATIDTAMQVHGAMGFTNELGLAEAWQQVRRICVADGSAEMMRRQVLKLLRDGDRPEGWR